MAERCDTSGRWETFMNAKLKPLSDQVVVVTAALSPVGLETARMAARRGAAVVVTAQDEAALRRLADSLNAAGGRVHPVAADLADADAAGKVARAAEARFGEIDSWINTGGEGGQAAVVNGSQAAARHFEARKAAGAVVNIGEAPSEAKTYTDALRRTLRKSRAQVSVTVVRRAHSPRAMARAALYAVQHPVGDLGVGPRGRQMTATETGVVVGLGAIALAATAAFLAREAIQARARPALARARRSVQRQAKLPERFAALRPQATARRIFARP
jgi:NAD(P)-dependent dehydrogenase (short-subunit alcohol dehydrogenase family)